MDEKMVWDVIVVGGGASGMMAAGQAAERGRSVLLLEKNNALGKKLNITGGGRCNITNAEFNLRTLLSHYGEAQDFLFSPFSQFGVQATLDFFAKLDLPIVIEARKRAFPASQNAPDVTRALRLYMRAGKVKVRTHTAVDKISQKEDGSIEGVAAGGVAYSAKNYIIATGGISYPETGSTGDGFKWLAELGHTVAKPTPTIVPLRVAEKWVHALSGTSLSFMKISFFADGKRSFSKTGKLLFTHFGLSGPLILNSAKRVSELLAHSKVSATIDMYPDTDFPLLERRILAILDANKNKNFKNILDEIVPHGLSETVNTYLNFTDPKIKTHSVTKEERKELLHFLKGAPITIDGLMGFDRAIVSDGGIILKEVDTRTMRSKLVPNLYLTGDILHINRPSGGYSLQLCWTTGFVAGSNV